MIRRRSFETTLSLVSRRVLLLSDAAGRDASMSYNNFDAMALAVRRARPSLEGIH